MTFTIELPQLTIIVIIFLNIIISIIKHGEEKQNKTHNVGLELLDKGFFMLILYWGGFFS